MGCLHSLTQGSSVTRRYIGTELVSDENSVGLNETEKQEQLSKRMAGSQVLVSPGVNQ